MLLCIYTYHIYQTKITNMMLNVSVCSDCNTFLSERCVFTTELDPPWTMLGLIACYVHMHEIKPKVTNIISNISINIKSLSNTYMSMTQEYGVLHCVISVTD